MAPSPSPGAAPHVPAISHFDIETTTRRDSAASGTGTPRTPRTPRGTLILQGGKNVGKAVLASPRNVARGIGSAMLESADSMLEMLGEKPPRSLDHKISQLPKKTKEKLEAEAEASKQQIFQEYLQGVADRKRQADGMRNWSPGESSQAGENEGAERRSSEGSADNESKRDSRRLSA